MERGICRAAGKGYRLEAGRFTALPQGQFTFAITQNGWTGTDETTPGIVLLLDAKDKSDLLKPTLPFCKKNGLTPARPFARKPSAT